MAGKIIADIIEAPYDSIRMNVGNVTVLTANNSGLTYVPTGNVNVNIGTTASLTLGNVTVSNLITANGGIKFPATQVASGDANTLDDYEEGTWTPALKFGGASVSLVYLSGYPVGRYTKIGNMVIASFEIRLSNKGSSTGDMTVEGLPFTSSSSLMQGAFFTFFGNSANGANWDKAQFVRIDENTAVLLLTYSNGGGNVVSHTHADVNNGGRYNVTAVYQI